MRALLRGQILKSLYDYPPLIYAVLVYIVFMVRCTLYLLFGIRKSPDGTIVRFVYVFIGMMFAQWIVKVVAQVCFGYYWFV